MNKQNIKSILTNARLRLVAATCLILAGLALPAAELARASEGRGGPPGPPNTMTFLIPASVCGFPVQGEKRIYVTAKAGSVFSLAKLDNQKRISHGREIQRRLAHLCSLGHAQSSAGEREGDRQRR